jgi:uncharacterized protein (TIGR03437 family)
MAVDAAGTAWVVNGEVSAIHAQGQGFIGNPRGTGYSGDGGPAQEARFNSMANRAHARWRSGPARQQSRAPADRAYAAEGARDLRRRHRERGQLCRRTGRARRTDLDIRLQPGRGRAGGFGGFEQQAAVGAWAAKVLFDGNAGAIMAVTPTQINVCVPYYVTPGQSTRVSIEVDDALSDAVSVPVAPTAPGVASLALNQDGTINSAANPAAAGSVVSLFGTGEGLAAPFMIAGDLSISTPYSVPAASVSVAIGGQAAQVTYAGAAPLMPIGVLQVNVKVPAGISGNAPVMVDIGGNLAPAISLAVR